MGFPSSKMDTITERCSTKGYEVKEEESMITIDCQTDIARYNVWKQEQRNSKLDNDKKISNIDTQEDVLSEIATYPLATITPMEAQQFLYDNQMRLNGDI